MLESGIRLRGKAGTPWLLRVLAGEATRGNTATSPARLAISVPKRFVKSSVSRNYLKRQAREAFRQHRLRLLPVDMLISVVTPCPDEARAARAANRAALVLLLDQAAGRMSAVPSPTAAG